MIKKRNVKKRMAYMLLNGVHIKCSYCTLKESCSTRSYKEQSENYGFKTYCTLTPNKTKKFLKKKRG